MSRRAGVGRCAGVLATMLVSGGCEAVEPELTEPEAMLGELVSSGSRGGLYRLDRRVTIVLRSPTGAAELVRVSACGVLTEQAAADIDRTIDALDPAGEHAVDAQACRDRYGEDVTASRIHIDGFVHDPFVCASECCAEELVSLLRLYTWVWAGLEGQEDELAATGLERYDALEPGRRCDDGD